MPTPPVPTHRRLRRSVLAVTTALAALALTACGSGPEYFGVRTTTKGAPQELDRKAGAIVDGTAVCISNASADVLSIQITGSEGGQAGYGDTDGAEDLAPGTQRCMKSDVIIARDTARASITIASGERFSVAGFNPPTFDEPWIGVNGDNRALTVGATTEFKIGKHPIVAGRRADVNGWKFFTVRIA